MTMIIRDCIASYWIVYIICLYLLTVSTQDLCPCAEVTCEGTSCSCYSDLSVSTSSKGTSFVVVFMENGAPDVYNLEVFVSSAHDSDVNVTLYTPADGSGLTANYTIMPKEVARIPISDNMVHLGTSMSNKAVLITSTHNVVVYALNRKGFSSDGFSVLPEIALDTEYYIVSFFEPKYWQQFAVVSLHNNTLALVSIPRPVGTPAIPSHIKWRGQVYLFGDTIKLEMDRYETAQIQGNKGNPNTGYWENADKYDLSGVHIKSDKPIAVFSGNYRTSVPSYKDSRDHVVEQLIPTSSWGQRYVMLLIDERNRTWENYFSVTALYDNTGVRFSNNTIVVLHAGETMHSSFSSSLQLTSNHPIQVAQYTPSSPTNKRGNEGDPSMIILPSLSNWDSEYIFATPSSSENQKYTDHAYVAVTAGMEVGLRLNGENLTDIEWLNLDGEISMVWAMILLPHGEFVLSHIDRVAFMCILYGYDDRESYGLNAGGIYARTGLQLLRPSVDFMYPSNAFGPESGGTYLNFHGDHLGGINSVVLTGSEYNSSLQAETTGNIQHCTLMPDKSNHTVLTCQTTPSQHVGVYNISLEQRFTSEVNDSYTCRLIYQTSDQFEYKQDPVVLEIRPIPPKTIKEGGIQVDVIGVNMNSVKHPLFVVNEYDSVNNVTTVYTDVSKPCELLSSEVIRCYTPPIPVRDVTKRAIQTGKESDYFNSDSREYYLGLMLDGIDTYSDLRTIIGDSAGLMVARDAVLEPFEEDPLIYDVTKQTTLEIKGNRLNSGATIRDFTVHIGHMACNVTDLGYNYLICEPPAEQPDNRVDGNSDTVPVDVTIGFRTRIRLGAMKWAAQKETLQIWVIVVVAIAATLSIILVVIITIIVRYRINANNRNSQNDMLKKIRPELRNRVLPFLIQPKLLDRGSQIGSGHFGVVYKGTLFNSSTNMYSSVAVKGFGANTYTVRDVEEFLNEAVKLQGMEHANLLTVLGVVIENNRPYMVLPLMDHGDMKSFLAQPEQKLTVGDLVFFGFQVSVGMAFLEQNKVIHADLAARNCMIDKNFIVKVADFGLSKILSNTEDYYTVNKNSQPLPVKWLALECLTQGKLSSKSDVWSFGVLLWEFMTRGQNPYPDITNSEVKDYLKRGDRMSQPDYCPAPVYDIMQRCWFASTEHRPAFSDLKDELSELLSVASDNLYVRNVTQELPYTYYLNEEFLQLPKQFVCENAYVKLMSEEAGYLNDGFDRQYNAEFQTMNSRTGILEDDAATAKINCSTAF